MALDNLGSTYENRTLQFCGCAYGNTSVSITATINGVNVFSGDLPTADLPLDTPANSAVMFSVANTTLFPTNWAGSYPMSITVNSGNGLLLDGINSNYMRQSASQRKSIMENSSITGTTLSVGTVSSGTVELWSLLNGSGVVGNTFIVGGSGSSWTVNNDQTVASTTLTGTVSNPGTGSADVYSTCYNGYPTYNPDLSPYPYSNVAIDGITQIPPRSIDTGSWIVPVGSTITFDLNVALGNCAQA